MEIMLFFSRINRFTVFEKPIYYSGVDPGLILGCCKILQKKIEHRNDIIMQKNYRFSKKQEGTVLITVGVQI